ncbi:hypothetical protein SERLADRAFT_397836 [Serpula lacrymans var. lacrymans S7.9]|uniref:Uncharacterized protein n=1 Tax=Serpula lacrymans var. lacrymans (strain S7.9) TaxID=578457 RepID=F8P644_SERL9|nr:uncharacterized protein SERLADRAFT_397836 [Serpula lacrymans var. lacrymans S7.9]EGO20911.1 hypothetical protein SERLADRAFT_397836 [Serpula lacrymans var. lacrymans S7.9]
MAPWYEIPRDVSSAANEAKMGWAYLKRCTQSGSMRNRRRIWLTAERIEKLANQMGV